MSTNQITLHDDYSVTQMIDGMKAQIVGGETDPLKAFIALGKIEKAVKAVKDDRGVLECALSEFSKYGSRNYVFGDCEVSQIEAGVKYDFSVSEDIVLNDMYAEMDALKLRIKERETMLKALPDKGMVCPDTGSFIYRPVRTGKTTLKLNFKK